MVPVSKDPVPVHDFVFCSHQVMQSLRFALQPAVVDISVTWDLPKGVSATVLSPPITALFQGQRSLIYAQLTGQVGAAPSHSEIPIILFHLVCYHINTHGF